MSITIRNDYLEQRIEREAQYRGHKTRTQTLEELANERLTQLEIERRQDAPNRPCDSEQRSNPAA